MHTVCLINVYMPSRGAADCDLLFQTALDEINENLEKYKYSHKILFGGDLNASLHRPEPIKRQKILQDFLSEHNLILPDNYPSQYTYYREEQMLNFRLTTGFSRLGMMRLWLVRGIL